MAARRRRRARRSPGATSARWRGRRPARASQRVERRAARGGVGRPSRAVDELDRLRARSRRARARRAGSRAAAGGRPVVGRVDAPVHASAGRVGRTAARVDVDHAPTSRIHDLHLRPQPHLRHRQGRRRPQTRSPRALGLAAARAGGARSSARSPSRIACPACSGATPMRPEQELELADGLWATSIDPQVALEEWLATQVGGGRWCALLGQSSALSVLRRRRARRARAGHDREGLGAGTARALEDAAPRATTS